MLRNAKHRKITDTACEIVVDGMAYYLDYVERTWWLYVPGDARPYDGYPQKRDAIAAIERYHTPRIVEAHRRAVARETRNIRRQTKTA